MKEEKAKKHKLSDIDNYDGKFQAATIFIPLVIYFFLYAMVLFTSSSSQTINIGIDIVPLSNFTGVFALMQSACVIIVTLCYRKLGFRVFAIIIAAQVVILLFSVFKQHIYSGISGFFSAGVNFFTSLIIYRYMNKIEMYQKEMRTLALTDALTGLPNRRASVKYIDRMIDHHEKFALVMIDLNNFKKVNDLAGHAVGNKVLQEISLRWKNLQHNSAEGTTDYIARQGGDEFILIICGYKDEKQLVERINTYSNVLNEKLTLTEGEFYLTASYGYAEYPTDSTSEAELFSYSDTAMFRAKSEKHRHAVHFSDNMNAEIKSTVVIEQQIRDSLDKNEFFFALQPQYNADTHKLYGFEALARMKNNGTVISPAKFIPVAEKAGIIDKIDSYVLRNSIEFFSRVIRETGTKCILSVNASVIHLLKSSFVDEVKAALEEFGMPPEQLEIEITESIMINSMETAENYVEALKAMGIKIAIDDFGTGYSSLSYLNTIPADAIKIDKSFIDRMNVDNSGKQYVSAIISIGHIMNFKVVSEGVEQPEQLETLKAIGCDIIQGYIWGKPVSPEEAEKLVKNELNS